MKELAIGITNFADLVADGSVYVDKTELIYELVRRQGKAYFLSRPRRFGKSLLLSVLASILRGERELFDGLWIGGADYDWEPHAVIELDFSRLESGPGLAGSLVQCLKENAERLGVAVERGGSPAQVFARLVTQLRARGRVALLIDEYDSPLIKHLNDGAQAAANRSVLQGFFDTVKALQAQIRFTFVTGVSRFAKVSLFSGMNGLDDISFDARYAGLLGFSESEVRSCFEGQLAQLGDVLAEMTSWYGGYRFSPGKECETVCNPWSVLCYLKEGVLENYWFETGTPKFAIELIVQRQWSLADLTDPIICGAELKQSYDPGSIDLASLLFQAGYLTFEKGESPMGCYSLHVPNEEVMRSLVDHLLVDQSEAEEGDVTELVVDDVKFPVRRMPEARVPAGASRK